MGSLIRFSDKQWREKKAVLDQMLGDVKDEIHYTKITRYGTTRVALEGGKVTVVFDTEDLNLYVWNRLTRYSGSEVAVRVLSEIERIMREWYEKEIRG